MSRASCWNPQRAYAAEGGASAAGRAGGPSASPFWPSGGVANDPFSGGWWKMGPWRIAAMVLGFIVWWPLGLAILFYTFWSRKGCAMRFADVMEKSPFSRPSTGNMAFDDWRRTELERIEKERQRLHDAEKEFTIFADELKRAKDREEFDRFMQARRSPANPAD